MYDVAGQNHWEGKGMNKEHWEALLTIPVKLEGSVLECANSNETGKWLRVTKEGADLCCTLTHAQLAAIVAWMEDEE